MSDLIKTAPRKIFEWIEIDQDQCTLDYGNSPCEAVIGTTGADKCFNTRETCQDPGNYDRGTLTLRFCRNQGTIPGDNYYFPYLQSAKVSPAQINPGGANRNQAALGVRGQLSVTLSDHPHTDRIVDPYQDERSYIATDQGTFWSKWKARNPYYMHRVIRYKSGYFDENGDIDAGTLITKTFFITDIAGPTAAGSVTIRALDVLTLAANEKAKAPTASTGKLLAAITDVSPTLTLTPAGIGNAEYPASGKVRVNKEIMSFARVSDVLTLTRAQNNTDAAAHDINDAVQLCLEYTSELPADILEDLLTNYAGVDSSYLDLAQWATESASFLPRLYTTIITEPTGVSQLINEMTEQMYFTTFWNEREALLKLRAIRPAEDEAITDLNDDFNLLQDSIQWTDKADSLITKVFVYYAQKDPTESVDDASNYGALDVIVDTDAEGDDKYGIEKVKTVYARWLTGSDGAAAVELGEKMLTRYNKIPRECVFSVDAKDRNIWLADFIRVTNRNVVDFAGLPVPVAMQIISAQESQQGTTYTYKATEYIGNPDTARVADYPIDISTDQVNVDLRALFDSKYGITPISGDKVRFTIRANVTVGGQVENIPSYTGDVSRLDGTGTIVAAGTHVLPYLQRHVIASNKSYAAGDEYNDPSTGTPTGYFCLADVEERPATIAIETGTWPAGVEVFLDIEAGAQVLGEGGNGGYCGLYGGLPFNFLSDYVRAGDGGHALKIDHPITINNLGTIAGGGGGGEVAAQYGGGARFVTGGGGAGYDNGYQPSIFDLYPVNGALIGQPSLGNKESRGTSGIYQYQFLSPDISQWVSGDGGALASIGDTSNSGVPGTSPINYNQYGRAGFAVFSGANDITWVQKGDVQGAEFA